MLIDNVTIRMNYGSTAVLSYYFNVVFTFACLCVWHTGRSAVSLQGLIKAFFSLLKFESYF